MSLPLANERVYNLWRNDITAEASRAVAKSNVALCTLAAPQDLISSSGNAAVAAFMLNLDLNKPTLTLQILQVIIPCFKKFKTGINSKFLVMKQFP